MAEKKAILKMTKMKCYTKMLKTIAELLVDERVDEDVRWEYGRKINEILDIAENKKD